MLAQKKKKKERRTTCLYVVDIPLDIKMYFKAYCAKMGKSQSAVIKSFMRRVTEDAREADRQKKKKNRLEEEAY